MAEADKKLYIVHVGFYDRETNYGIYESHTNFFIAASSPQEAKKIAKENPIYRDKKMHTDGIQEIGAVQGYRVKLVKDPALDESDVLKNSSYDELNPTAPISGV